MTDNVDKTNYEKTEKMSSIVPYSCVFIDADWRQFLYAGARCFKGHSDREGVIEDIKTLWTNQINKNHVLPCLSVRTAFDLYLKVKQFPPGSEVIMSAINIPDMVHVIKDHKLKVVPLDINIETMEPKLHLLPRLITNKSVAILVAHVFGKHINMEPFIEIARENNLTIIEDMAEAFCGLQRLGHTESDLSLFSFGAIKTATAFGGAIAKIKDDDVYSEMCRFYDSYTTQKHKDYLKKLLKYFIAHMLLDVPSIQQLCRTLGRTFNIDHKAMVVNMLRGFPEEMMKKIKTQPSTALLATLRKRFSEVDQSDFMTGQVKCEYVRMRLPEDVQLVGMDAMVNNYWLFPFLVETPDNVVKQLNAMGVDAYRGATQLNMIAPDPSSSHGYITPVDPRYPSEARYLIDHVVYIPVHKNVPFHVLNRICEAVNLAVSSSKDSPKVTIRSKM